MATRTTKTTTKSTTTRARSTKPRTTKTTTSTKTKTTAAASTTAAPVVVDAPTPVVAGPTMRKKELIEAVVARSGIKKKDAKPVVEAMLSVLGEALQDGRGLNLQPMGKVKINREKKLASGRMFVARIRQSDRQVDDGTEGETSASATATATDKAAE